MRLFCWAGEPPAPLTLTALLLGSLAFAQPPVAPEKHSFVIVHVGLIDASGTPLQPDMTVVVEGDRITAVGKSTSVHPPQGIATVDGTGKFLIPGLWDMHVHGATDKDVFLPLFVANGITGVRSMFDPFEEIQKRRQEIAAGTLIGPRIIAGGPIVDGPKAIWPGSISVSTAEEGRAAVDKLKKMGTDFVKVYSGLPKDAYFAIADEAKKQKIPFEGHVPSSVTAGEASDAGQESIEHLTGILSACSNREAEIRRKMAAAQSFADYLRINAESGDSYDKAKCAALFTKFVKNQTWQVPTLTVLRSFGSMNDIAFTNDPRMKYMPAAIKQFWNPKANPMYSAIAAEDYAAQKKVFAKELDVVREMHRAGVPIMAGTDTLNPYVFPGFSLHDELQLLVKAGFTPMEALQSATMRPALFLGMRESSGPIGQGKLANLVMLDANPLEDIANTQKIRAVVVAGRLLDRAYLDKSLAAIATQSNPPASTGAAKAPVIPESGLVADFEQAKPESKFGAGWIVSTDSMAGGKSTAALTIASEGAAGTGHSLLIEGEVIAGPPFAWAGALFSPGPAPMAPANLASKKQISFWAKGEGKSYDVMMFAQSLGMMPAIQNFTAGPEWKQFTFPFTVFNGIDGHDTIGIFFGAGPTPGKFKLFIDQVTLQ